MAHYLAHDQVLQFLRERLWRHCPQVNEQKQSSLARWIESAIKSDADTKVPSSPASHRRARSSSGIPRPSSSALSAGGISLPFVVSSRLTSCYIIINQSQLLLLSCTSAPFGGLLLLLLRLRLFLFSSLDSFSHSVTYIHTHHTHTHVCTSLCLCPCVIVSPSHIIHFMCIRIYLYCWWRKIWLWTVNQLVLYQVEIMTTKKWKESNGLLFSFSCRSQRGCWWSFLRRCIQSITGDFGKARSKISLPVFSQSNAISF